MRFVSGEDQVREDAFFTAAVDTGDLMKADDSWVPGDFYAHPLRGTSTRTTSTPS